ncbi:MAG: hypothetical protein A4E69_01349 [Syntrophus sp. PtaB.Bin138]|nr:MAG: hypothetical protein A4E69_01349 [Syntrophus sp. PtaB.Bin138]
MTPTRKTPRISRGKMILTNHQLSRSHEEISSLGRAFQANAARTRVAMPHTMTFVR